MHASYTSRGSGPSEASAGSTQPVSAFVPVYRQVTLD